MIYKAIPEPDETLSLNEGFTDSTFWKTVVKIFEAIRDAIKAAWKFVKDVFSKVDEKTSNEAPNTTVTKGDDATASTINNADGSVDVEAEVTFTERKQFVRVNFGPMYMTPRHFEKFAENMSECIGYYKELLVKNMSPAQFKTRIDVTTNRVASLIGATTNPKTWKTETSRYFGDTRKEDYVYISEVVSEYMPFQCCKSKEEFEDCKKCIDRAIKMLDKSASDVVTAVKGHGPDKCKSGFTPKFWNDTADYGDINPQNFGHVLYDIAIGLNDITTLAVVSLKTYAKSLAFVRRQYTFIEDARKHGRIIKENTEYSGFVTLIK